MLHYYNKKFKAGWILQKKIIVTNINNSPKGKAFRGIKRISTEDFML